MDTRCWSLPWHFSIILLWLNSLKAGRLCKMDCWRWSWRCPLLSILGNVHCRAILTLAFWLNKAGNLRLYQNQKPKSLKAHVFSKKSRHSLDISRNGTRKNCIRSTHYIPSSRAGIHPFYLANDCTFPLDFCSVDRRNPVARSQIENDGVTWSISFPVRWSKLIWLKKKRLYNQLMVRRF